MTPGRVRAARTIAVAADLLQIAVFPAFVTGAASPWNDALDVLVAGAMALLIGWHWAFLPSFLAELLPGFDLVPTWTAAVFFATRGKGRPSPADASARDAIDTEVVSSTPAARPPGQAVNRTVTDF